MRNASRLLLVAVLAGGVGVGFLAGRVTAPLDDQRRERASEPVPEPAGDTAASPSAEHEGASDGAPERRARQNAESAEHPPGASAGELLRRQMPDAPEARLAEADRRAEVIRGQARSTARSANSKAAREVLEAIRKERAFLADQASGGTMSMLRTLKDAEARPFLLVADAAAFSTHFERKTTGPEIDPTTEPLEGVPEPGTVLRFPAGMHTLGVTQWGRGDDFPADLVIEGAGRDRTIVRFDEFSARGEVRNLTFRDVTVDAGDNYLTDLRLDAPVTIRMERCRVVGFDIGAGGSVMLAARTAAFYATDTTFEAGWGRNPGSGNLFRVRSGLLARLERCTFLGPFRSVYDTNAAATYVFDGCRFVNQPVPLENAPDGVRFVECESVQVAADEVPDPSSWLAGAVFPDEAGALVVDGVAGTVPEGATGPVVLVFPAGQHTLVAGKNLGAYRGPLIVRGQGKDATLLRVGGQPQTSTLVVKDVTVDMGHSPIVGSQVAFARLERVRLLRWDTGAGGSTALDQRSSRLVVLDGCEVLDGFGRSHGRGTFASVDRGTLRIERSTIDLRGSAFLRGSGKTVLVDSVVSGVRPTELEQPRRPHTLHLIRSTLTPLPAGFERPKERRALSELNGAWAEDR